LFWVAPIFCWMDDESPGIGSARYAAAVSSIGRRKLFLISLGRTPVYPRYAGVFRANGRATVAREIV
jgi:hypothetical protein